MSHADIRDLDCPPGLAALHGRANVERETIQGIYYPRAPQGYSAPVTRIEERDYGVGPNRHNSNGDLTPGLSFSSSNHYNPPPSPSFPPLSPSDRDPHSSRATNTATQTQTLWWGDLEPWMDEEYARQVCNLLGWNPVNIRVPRPPADPLTGQQHNNPGYCYLTFPTAAQAAAVLAQISPPGANSATMPNSTKPFTINWASAITPPLTSSLSQNAAPSSIPQTQYPKEYSIFVGDLAPQTSNSDLVAVFRNPVLGLRNDREPKFIRPFLSCKSAKIMLDPVTGVSRGYGFVRFTDEADQQRALIEMHGLYCLSRPMRISPATAKYKLQPLDPQVHPSIHKPVAIALSLPNSGATKSVTNPIAAASSTSSFNGNGNGVSSSGSGSSIGASNSSNSLSSSSNTSISSSGLGSMTPEEMANLPHNVLAQLAQQYAKGEVIPAAANNPASISQSIAPDAQIRPGLTRGEGAATPRYMISEESWKHHAQARAILGNLIGPNGEQLTSSDPYNTTVFVGGLSPLISEETLKTFFIPFGEIHYVKVPVGKHCGFVQFVRKVDAERAIEKMQGFPIGGSRIRLSWGRSQYKAAQAAAQAAQAAALQNHVTVPGSNMMTQEQALQILQKLSIQGYIDNPVFLPDRGGDSSGMSGGYSNTLSESGFSETKPPLSALAAREDGPLFYGSYPSNGFSHPLDNPHQQSTFSPFSPDPNISASDTSQRESYPRLDALPHPSKAYAPGFFPLQNHGLNDNTTNLNMTSLKASPTSIRPVSATHFNAYLDDSGPFTIGRGPSIPDLAISRPSSGSTAAKVQAHETQEFDHMHDLNGTLASLELDRPWRSSQDNGQILSIRKASDRTPSPAKN